CPHRLARAGRCACPDAGRSATHCRFYPSSAFCHAQQPPDTRDQRPAPLALAPRLWATGPTGGVVQAQTMSSLARSRDLRRAAIVPRTARGAVSGEPTRLSLAPDHLGHDLTRCRALSKRRSGGTVLHPLGSGNPSGATQDHHEDGCAALQNGPGGAEGIDDLRHNLQSRSSGYAPISSATTDRGRAYQLSRCVAVVRCAQQWDTVRGVGHQSLAAESGGTSGAKAATQEVSLHDETTSYIA